jgi:hypothetical protein
MEPDERNGQPAHQAEVLTISRKRILTTDLLCGIAAGLVIAAAMLAYTLYFSEWLVFGSILGVLPFLVYLALRRYLRSITLDSERKILVARSIFPWVTFTIPFANVQVVRSVKRHGGYNVVVKRSRVIQPLLFETWTAEEDRDMQTFMAVLSSHGLNVKQ